VFRVEKSHVLSVTQGEHINKDAYHVASETSDWAKHSESSSGACHAKSWAANRRVDGIILYKQYICIVIYRTVIRCNRLSPPPHSTTLRTSLNDYFVPYDLCSKIQRTCIRVSGKWWSTENMNTCIGEVLRTCIRVWGKWGSTENKSRPSKGRGFAMLVSFFNVL
jgi:hypothetical protein